MILISCIPPLSPRAFLLMFCVLLQAKERRPARTHVERGDVISRAHWPAVVFSCEGFLVSRSRLSLIAMCVTRSIPLLVPLACPIGFCGLCGLHTLRGDALCEADDTACCDLTHVDRAPFFALVPRVPPAHTYTILRRRPFSKRKLQFLRSHTCSVRACLFSCSGQHKKMEERRRRRGAAGQAQVGRT